MEEKQASEEEATCTIKSLKKELKQKTERLRALQQKPDDVVGIWESMSSVRSLQATIGDDERVAELEQELEEAQRLQAESQDVIKALRTELEDGEDRMKKLREELEEAKVGASVVVCIGRSGWCSRRQRRRVPRLYGTSWRLLKRRGTPVRPPWWRSRRSWRR